MYKNIVKMDISRHFIVFQTTDMVDELEIQTNDEMYFTEKDFVVVKRFDAADIDGNLYIITLYKNNITIKNEAEEVLCKFYMPDKVKYAVEKDVKEKSLFSLMYRKHLLKEYDSTKHVLLALNNIPEDYQELVDKAIDKVSKYSTGMYNMPILVCYYDDVKKVLAYGIVKNNIAVEYGVLGKESSSVHTKNEISLPSWG